MSKGQAQIFTEFLSFAIGLLVTISIAFIFSTSLSPRLINEALDYHMDNIIKQVETAASQLRYYSEYFGNKTVTMKLDLPPKLNKNTYELYKFGDELCVSISSTQSFKCADNTYNVQGSFVSGTRMRLTLSNNKITMSAD
mgnify:CR=1 FL=1